MSNQQVIFDQGPLSGRTAFTKPKQIIQAATIQDVPAAFDALENARARGDWLAGYASYELGYAFSKKLRDLIPSKRKQPLLCFGVFDAPILLDQRQEDARASITRPIAQWSQEAYSQAFALVKNYISAGDVYQVNLTFPMHAKYSGSPRALYEILKEKQSTPYGAFVNLGGPVLLSRSPELFFAIDAKGNIEAKPMKGTAARGATDSEDAAQIVWLQASEKNRAENMMIVDLMRNDISRLAEIGSVKTPELFSIETYETLHQMTSRITARLLPDLQIFDIFAALFPCGSITGAPKIRAMQIIREAETRARGAYCGSIGWIAPDGRMQFNVAIRTVICSPHGEAQLNVGGGIVYDSTPEDEFMEALLKAQFVASDNSEY